MCKAIEKALADKGFGLDNGLSEIDMMVAEDDNFRRSHNERKMNRAERRHATATKKHHLGKAWWYANEHIDAYWVEKVDDKKITHWIGDPEECNGLPLAENQEYWNEIPWNRVKACHYENYGYKQYSDGKTAWSRKTRYQKIEMEPDESDFEIWYRTVYLKDILPDRKEWLIGPEEYLEDGMFYYGLKNHIFETQYTYAEWKSIDKDGNRTVHDPDIDNFIFNHICFDTKVREQLKNCRKSIDRWQRIVALERQRAYLMAEVHRLDREIRKVIAEDFEN